MAFRHRREKLRSILNGPACIRPGRSMTRPRSALPRISASNSACSAARWPRWSVLGDPDIALITLTELAEQMRRMSRAAELAGAGRCRSRLWQRAQRPPHRAGTRDRRRRRPDDRGYAAAAGLRAGQAQLISLEEGIGKMKAALDGRGDPSLVIMGRTGAAVRSGLEDASCARRPMRPPASMRCFSPASEPRRAGGDLGRDHAADRAWRRARGDGRARLSRRSARADCVAGPRAIRRRHAGRL